MITINQFNNILIFIAITSHSTYVMGLSPDYILEKYSKFVGNPEDIHDEVIGGGVHEVLKRDLINPYHEKWKTQELKFIRNATIKGVLNE